jgi:HPt (histidine-containing phosphotransfer) domain-containing protein
MMDQATEALLSSGGVDLAATVARFGSNEALLLKYLRRFPADTSLADMQAAQLRGDGEALYVACHTLKGVSGTLGLQPLYEAACALLAALRASAAADIPALMANVEAAHGQALALVARLEGG